MRTLLLLSIILCSSSTFAQWYVTTFAGDGVQGFINGPGDTARFREPSGICMDNTGNIFIADGGNNVIRKIDPAGIVSTYAGTTAGYLDGPASTAKFNDPFCVCVDATGNVYVSDFNNQRIRKISVDGIVSTIAGSGVAGYVDGPAGTAQFNYPRGITIDQNGNLFIADSWNHRIRKIDGITYEVSTYAGGGSVTGVSSVGDLVDGQDTSARFYTPTGVDFDDAGNLYVADALNHHIRLIDPSQYVTTIAGSDSVGGFLDGDALAAKFNTPTDLHYLSNGDLLIGDTYNYRVRLLSATGLVSTYAGNGNAGFLDGPDSLAELDYPRAICSDPSGDSIFVCDFNNHSIRLATAFTTNTGELQKNLTLKIFPNPADEFLNLSMNVGPCTIRIFDELGTLKITHVLYTMNDSSIDIRHLSAGVYYIKANIQGSVFHAKFIKL